MSPEQVRGEPVDHRSDIFSFGAILYEMLVGRRAFQRETMAETMTAILKEEPPDLTQFNSRISADLERVINHCLEKRREDRFQSAHDLGFALGASSASSGTGLQDAGIGPAPTGRAGVVSNLRRQRLPWIVAAVCLLGLLGTIPFVLGYFLQPRSFAGQQLKLSL